MGELERLLPDNLRSAAVSSGHELVLPYAEALRAIGIATEHQIAILGLEAFEVQKEGLLTVDYTGYDRDIPFTGDWKAYVARSQECLNWARGDR
ncbi:MAG: hypothetical protein DMG32_16910 [Acidobacteria bacterium]|nr:MAG: hypothetical protein DMG32_16910 [Acidobacteriota bacterium]